MRRENFSRRQFLTRSLRSRRLRSCGPQTPQPLLSSAAPRSVQRPFPRWPAWTAADEQAILSVLRSGVLSRAVAPPEAELLPPMPTVTRPGNLKANHDPGLTETISVR